MHHPMREVPAEAVDQNRRVALACLRSNPELIPCLALELAALGLVAGFSALRAVSTAADFHLEDL